MGFFDRKKEIQIRPKLQPDVSDESGPTLREMHEAVVAANTQPEPAKPSLPQPAASGAVIGAPNVETALVIRSVKVRDMGVLRFVGEFYLLSATPCMIKAPKVDQNGNPKPGKLVPTEGFEVVYAAHYTAPPAADDSQS